MMSGARTGRETWPRRLVARAAARHLTVFVVPGLEMARTHGLDLAAAGLHPVSSPRHAGVLLLVGEIPDGLARAVAVVYAQMPRPRAILAVGSGRVAPLPAPDVAVTLDQEALLAGVTNLCRLVATGAWSPDAPAFDVPEVQPMADDGRGGMEHDSHGGMDMPGQYDQDAGHGEGVQGQHPDHGGEHEQHSDHGGNTHGGGTHGMPMPHEGHDEMGGMDHAGMEMGGEGMSMVMMTKDLPRSPDGLPMEWVEAPFGPLFPGLPGGLALSFTLDGDAVARATVTPGTVTRGLEASWPGPAATLPERVARLDPLAPVAYRLLATRALENATGIGVDEATARARIGALERERAASHLGWLVLFGELLGDRWMAARAAALQRALLHADDPATIERLRAAAGAFTRRVQRTPYLRRRLAGVGAPRGVDSAGPFPRGPVARAAGLGDDARAADPLYRRLAFAPVTREGNDALARLLVRLGELELSLDLVLAAGTLDAPERPLSPGPGGTGLVTVETPRGAATLHLRVDDKMVRDVMLDTPSPHNLALVETVTTQREVADALIGIASLDLSPWEIDR